MQRHGDPRFYALLDEMAALHSNKNHDYAKSEDPFSNFRRSESFGVPAWKGVLTRMSDKWSRIEQIANGKEPKNESLRDSLIDNAVYSLIAVLLLEENPRALMSYDEKREHPVTCHCGRKVSQRCNGAICVFESSQGSGHSEEFRQEVSHEQPEGCHR